MKVTRSPKADNVVAPRLRVFGVAAICVCLSIRIFAAGAPTGPAGRLNTIAPDFIRTDLAGRPLRLDQFRGRVVLLNFWATWCGPCLEEIPVFSRWQRQYGDAGLQVIGVSMDDDEAVVRRFLVKQAVPYPILMGDANLGERFGGVYGLPQSFLIDARGLIVFRGVGEPNIEALRSQIEGLIGIH
ncbi:MAG: TlpA family protein disulfide reductase [Beijerinckiaceae bacterium]